MKKSIKLQFLATSLLLALFQQNQYASNDDIKVKPIMIPITLGSIGLGLKILKSQLSAHTALQTSASMISILAATHSSSSENYVQNNYPNLKLFMNEMSNKYPDAQFDKRFLKENSILPHDHGMASLSYGQDVLLSDRDLTIINNAYRYQNNEWLTDADMQKISAIEWKLLHQVNQADHHDFMTKTALGVGITAGLEFGYQKYKKNSSITTPKTVPQSTWHTMKNIPKRAAIVTTMFGCSAVISTAFAKYNINRADAFANKHADTDSLRASISNFQDYHNKFGAKEANIPSFLQVNPSNESRIQNMKDEIKRRESKN